MTILNFELFKDQKKLDKEYFAYMNHCNKFFGTDVTPQGLFKRLYFATRYLEGTVNGYTIFSKLGITEDEYKKGTMLFCDWLEDIVRILKEEITHK